MTTVAYRMGMIAADTGVNIGDARVGEMSKIARNSKGDLAGASGGAGFCYNFLAWFLKGREGPEVEQVQAWLDSAPEPGIFEDDSVERGFFVQPAEPNLVWVLEPDGWFRLPCPYYATGGGREFAMGCMWKGGDAQEAVSAAMQYHCFTFGSVEHLRF